MAEDVQEPGALSIAKRFRRRKVWYWSYLVRRRGSGLFALRFNARHIIHRPVVYHYVHDYDESKPPRNREYLCKSEGGKVFFKLKCIIMKCLLFYYARGYFSLIVIISEKFDPEAKKLTSIPR